MIIYTDGSALKNGSADSCIGWAAVCNRGVICSGARHGGTNVNAEMKAIEHCLSTLKSYKRKLLEGEDEIEIITDSKISIQIIQGMMRNPDDYDLKASLNYESAFNIIKTIEFFETEMNKTVKFTHIRGHRDSLGNNFADYVATACGNRLYETI